MQLIDTHTHIYHEDFKNDIAEVIDRAKKAGVEKILLPNIDRESIDSLHNLCDAYPNYCVPMMGLHPTSVTTNWKEDLAYLKSLFANRTYIAVGEVGVDLYWDQSLKEEQMLAFKEQLEWSIEYDLPVSIHSRNATTETIECIKEVGASKLRGVFHSFTGTSEELKDILPLENFLFGINGVSTFKNSSIPEALKLADLSRIIIETDAPYLAPVPHRGKRNEPSYTLKIAERLSDIYGISPDKIGQITTRNAKELFSFA